MHYLTYMLVRLLLGLLGLLPVSMASRLGGKLAQLIGPQTKRHKVALKNLKLIYPEQTDEWRNETASNMWNHLGRLLAELPALKSGKLLEYVGEVEGKENIVKDGQVIYVSAHFGQWELLTPTAKKHGAGPIASLYRHVNNRRLDELLKSYREKFHDELIRKKGDNAIALVRALKEGKSLAMLIDQRLTKGDVMPFLGVEGPTNTAAMKLAVKTNTPIVVAFITRTKGVSFVGELSSPISTPSEGGDEEKAQNMARQVFDIIEKKIHAHPEQYLWLHDRWK